MSSGPSAGRSRLCRSAARVHGKAAVLDLIGRLVPEVFQVFCFVPDTMLVDGDQVAIAQPALGQAHRRRPRHQLPARAFHAFRDGKVVENFSLIDSFDAVEQVLGHPLAMQADRSGAAGQYGGAHEQCQCRAPSSSRSTPPTPRVTSPEIAAIPRTTTCEWTISGPVDVFAVLRHASRQGGRARSDRASDARRPAYLQLCAGQHRGRWRPRRDAQPPVVEAARSTAASSATGSRISCAFVTAR